MKLPFEPLKQPSIVVLLELVSAEPVEPEDCVDVLDGLDWFGSGAVLDGFWVAGLWLVEF